MAQRRRKTNNHGSSSIDNQLDSHVRMRRRHPQRWAEESDPRQANDQPKASKASQKPITKSTTVGKNVEFCQGNRVGSCKVTVLHGIVELVLWSCNQWYLSVLNYQKLQFVKVLTLQLDTVRYSTLIHSLKAMSS
jgi:hypothetical protein